MADIAFLLLIFLVLTVTTETGANIHLPSFLYAQDNRSPNVVSIELNAAGSVRIDGNPVPTGNEQQLLQVLNGIATTHRTPVVRISADKGLAYARVDAVLAMLRKSGLTHVVLVARQPTANTP